jgi:uncharacterized Zn-binding protein involved in type VI secretion
MPAAARIGEQTTHSGVLSGSGVTSVRIGGLPAAVVDPLMSATLHACGFPPPTGPHPPSPLVGGSTSVRIGGYPAARRLDDVGCGAKIVTGADSVTIG